METTKQISVTQQKALDVVQELIKEEKITLQQAFDLITAIYENKPEFIYIPYTSPWIEPYRPYTTEPWTTTPKPNEPYTIPTTTPWPNVPWWNNQITCQKDTASNNANSTNRKPGYDLYAHWDYNDWINNILTGFDTDTTF